jgi:hypothetical protein
MDEAGSSPRFKRIPLLRRQKKVTISFNQDCGATISLAIGGIMRGIDRLIAFYARRRLAFQRLVFAIAPIVGLPPSRAFDGVRDPAQAEERNGVDGPMKAFEKDLAITRKLASADPGNVEVLRDLTVSLIRLADFKLENADSEGVLESYEQSLAIRRLIAAADPGKVRSQRDIANTLDSIADFKLENGDAEGALDAYEESLAIRKKLVAMLGAGDVKAQNAVAASYFKVAEAKKRVRDRNATRSSRKY